MCHNITVLFVEVVLKYSSTDFFLMIYSAIYLSIATYLLESPYNTYNLPII